VREGTDTRPGVVDSAHESGGGPERVAVEERGEDEPSQHPTDATAGRVPGERKMSTMNASGQLTATNKSAAAEHFRLAILGAGFGGLGMAIRLRRAGIEDFVVLERDADVGGTWWANTYPGCQCDIPSHLYSFSFAPNPEWTRTYPLQPEIKRYLAECTERYGLREHIRAGCEVTGAAWDEDEGVWRVETLQGSFTVDL